MLAWLQKRKDYRESFTAEIKELKSRPKLEILELKCKPYGKP